MGEQLVHFKLTRYLPGRTNMDETDTAQGSAAAYGMVVQSLIERLRTSKRLSR
jgi:hypothetical protein